MPNVSFENISLMHGTNVSSAGEGRRNVDLGSALMAIQQKGSLSCHTCSMMMMIMMMTTTTTTTTMMMIAAVFNSMKPDPVLNILMI